MDEHGKPSADEAFAEYRDAWIAQDKSRLFAVTDFRQSAAEDLRRGGGNPGEMDIADLASKRKAELQTHLDTRGFVPSFKECEVVKVVRDSATQVRFFLLRKLANAVIFAPLRVMRFAEGWRVVYGG